MWHYAPQFALSHEGSREPKEEGNSLPIKYLGAAAAVAVLAAPPAAATPPIIGAQGLVPSARELADYVASTYPGVKSIGGWRAHDPFPDHPSGRAIDIMVGGDKALGDVIAADIRSQSARFGVQYLLWQVVDHGDHIHVTVRG